MSTGLYKGMVLGLVAGLIIGVTGGYYGKNLDAKAPLGSTTYSSDSIESKTQGIIFHNAVEKAVNENGLDAVFGTKSSETSHNSSGLTNLGVLLTPFLGTALAQTDKCSGAELDLVRDILFGDLAVNYRSSECIEQVSYDGVLTYSLYSGRNSSGKLNKVKYTFRGVITVSSWEADAFGKCRKIVKKHALSIDGILFWNGSETIPGQGDEEWSNIDWTLVCEGSEEISWTWDNPRFDKEKCCGRFAPAPTEEEVL